ncbi:MAG: hypothetical protein AB1333_02140 [Patescibacteria group bacterium]
MKNILLFSFLIVVSLGIGFGIRYFFAPNTQIYESSVVNNKVEEKLVQKESGFIDCGEAEVKMENGDFNVNSLNENSKSSLKCYSSILESCKNGKFIPFPNTVFSISSNVESCSLNFALDDGTKAGCTFPKSLPGTFFASIFQDPENQSMSLEEKEIKKGMAFDMALIFGLAMQSGLNESFSTSSIPSEKIILENFYGSKVVCDEMK